MSNIAEADYVRWVQRSLNRLIHAQLPVDGVKNETYHNKVKDLQALSPSLRHYVDSNGIKHPMFGKVDERTQNVIVEWNATMFGYTKWVQGSLTKIGMHANLPTGVLDSDTLQSIKFFQKKKALKVDGWVGAKTETALMKAACSEPPEWELKAPKPWHLNEDWKIWCNRFIADILRELDHPTRQRYHAIDPAFRKAYHCVLHKITFSPGTFHGYLSPYWVQRWVWEGRDASDLKIMMTPALEELKKYFMEVYNNGHLTNSQDAFARFEHLVLEMLACIDAGRDRINYANSVLGDLGHMRALWQFWQECEKDSRTLYSCFQGHLKQSGGGPWSPSLPPFLDVLAKVRDWANSR